mgnify:CR=1 FL=1
MAKCKHGRATNIQLAEGVSLTFNSQEYNKLNLPCNGLGWMHQAVIGGTGTGKSRAYVRPNIYSLPTDPLTGRAISMVITDPKGELLNDTGAFLEAHGYEVKVFNLFQMDKSDCYNPFAYIHSENDVAVLVDGLVANMSSEKDKGDHWIANATAVLKSICYYIYYELPINEANFASVLNLLNLWDSSEDDDDFKSEYDMIMDKLEQEKGPEHTAVVWRKSVSAKGRELGSIISTASTICSIFNQSAIRTLTETDSMELDKIGDRPTALFVITPPTTRAFNFLAALMYTQLFTLLSNKANLTYKDQGMTLPHKVWFILDEFANVGKIPDFDVQITLIRSAGMFCSIIVQSPSQLEAIYKEITPTIMSNCSIILFLGSSGSADKDSAAADFISKNLGTKTIQAENTTVNWDHGSRQISRSYGPNQRPLMTPDEVKRLPAEDCIIMIGGQKPIRAKKNMKLEQCLNYDIYKKIGNYDLDHKKATAITYVEGREKSDEIQKQQDLERQAEFTRRKEFKAINSKYAKESGLPEAKTDTMPATFSFSGITTPESAHEMIAEPPKAFNWRAEFGEAVSDDKTEEFMQNFNAEDEPEDTPEIEPETEPEDTETTPEIPEELSETPSTEDNNTPPSDHDIFDEDTDNNPWTF